MLLSTLVADAQRHEPVLQDPVRDLLPWVARKRDTDVLGVLLTA
ncbi:hypothetical protein ACF1BE_26485 [Streptomyces sp. NPDC014991]